MTIKVPLSEDLVALAKETATKTQRSVSDQIEYWSRIGKAAEENPDLPFSFVRDILQADKEEAVEHYQFDQ